MVIECHSRTAVTLPIIAFLTITGKGKISPSVPCVRLSDVRKCTRI